LKFEFKAKCNKQNAAHPFFLVMSIVECGSDIVFFLSQVVQIVENKEAAFYL
jgi:hypothetical protein